MKRLALANARVFLKLNNKWRNDASITFVDVRHSSRICCTNTEIKYQENVVSHLSRHVISFDNWRFHLTLCQHDLL